MGLPRGVIGVSAALISFFAVGMPLYNRGVSFALSFLAQCGMMVSLIGIWLFVVERRTYKMIDGKPHVRHGLFGKWVELVDHLKQDHGEEIK